MAKSISNLHELQADPSLFQSSVHIPTGSGSRAFGDVMAEFQRDRFTIINPSLLAVAHHQQPPVPRIWDERTKGGSKDSDYAVSLLWLLAFSRRCLRIQVGAYDAQQADEIRLIVKAILKINSPVNNFLNAVVDVQTNRILNNRTESTVEILTTDRLGSHGARPDVVLINELTHQQDSGFAETLLDNLDKMPNGLGIIATNSGFDPSWQLQWKRTFAASERWRVLEYNQPAPWISQSALQESERRNSTGRFLRLWRGQWVSDTGDALDSTDIENSITQTAPMTGNEKGWLFVAGLDIGIKKDATGLVLVAKHVGHTEQKQKEVKISSHRRTLIEAGLSEEPEPEYQTTYHEATHRLRLAYCKAWKPSPGKRVSLEAVKAEILNVHQRFKLHGIALDPHQGEHLAELLQRENVPVLLTPQTSSSLQDQATALIECFQERTLDLYKDDDLLADLKGLRIKDSGLRLRLVSPESTNDVGTAHGDLASALSFAVSLAKLKNSLHFHDSSRNIIAWSA